MLCQPEKIRQLPEFVEFQILYIKAEENRGKNKRSIEKEMRSRYFKKKGIFNVHAACNSECVYWKDCLEEIEELKRSKNLNK
jgi:hypothetical protein